MILVRSDWPNVNPCFSLELRRGQHVDGIILGMRTDEFHESYLPAKSKATTRRWFPPATSNLTRSRFSTLALGAACLTSSVDIQCAALTSLYQRSRETFVSGWSAHDLVLCIS